MSTRTLLLGLACVLGLAANKLAVTREGFSDAELNVLCIAVFTIVVNVLLPFCISVSVFTPRENRKQATTDRRHVGGHNVRALPLRNLFGGAALARGGVL